MMKSSIASNQIRIKRARTAAKARVAEVLQAAVVQLQRIDTVDSATSRAKARSIIGLPPSEDTYIWDPTNTVGVDCVGNTPVEGDSPAELDAAMQKARLLVQRITDSIDAYMAGDDTVTEAIVAQFDKAAR